MTRESFKFFPGRTLTLGRLLITLGGFCVTSGAPLLSAAMDAGIPGKRVLSIEDYERWRRLESASISNDGKAVAYVVRYANLLDTQPIVRVVRLDSGMDWEITNADQPRFSDDGRWLAAFIDPPYQESRSLREAGKPIPRGAVLLNVVTGNRSSWDDVTSFEFAKGSRHFLIRHSPTAREEKETRADAVLRNLDTGHDLLLGNVDEVLFNPSGRRLAYTMATSRMGGVSCIDLDTGVVRVLDSGAQRYSQLSWSVDGLGLAILKGKQVEGKEERDNILLAYPDVRVVGKTVVMDPVATAGFPQGWVVSERGGSRSKPAVQWSSDRSALFFGIKRQRDGFDPAEKKRLREERPDVDVWHVKDPYVQSVQMVRVGQDRDFTYRQAFILASGRFVRLTDQTLREIELSPDGRWAVGWDERAYLSDWKGRYADLYRIDVRTGERKLIVREQMLFESPTSLPEDARTFGFSPDGRYFLFWRDDDFHVYDFTGNQVRPMNRTAPIRVTDAEYNLRGPSPPYGVAGWSRDGRFVVLNHRYDLWLQPLDGRTASKLTKDFGARNAIRLRYHPVVSNEAPERAAVLPTIDLSRPVLLAAYGDWTKRSGFYSLAHGKLRELIYQDADFSSGMPLSKARDAPRYLYSRQSFIEFPNLWVANEDFDRPRQLTDVNPQQAEYSWGRQILFEYTVEGVRMQGILAIPEDYRSGERRPMLVGFYEKRSSELNRHVAPSYLGDFYPISMEAVSKGYLVMRPDIHFGSRSAHADMLHSVEAAVRRVIEMGYADAGRIGLFGHSFGGQGGAYIATQSDLFAAIGLSAGATELWSEFSRFWGWSYEGGHGTGNSSSWYDINGQGRMGTDPWTDPQLYREQSAMTHVRSMNRPLLLMHGTADGTVSIMEALQFYSALRFHGKDVVLLAYPGEGHSLEGLANKRDFTIRAMQFFDHHLRGIPAPRWMTEGVPFIDKGREGLSCGPGC